MELKLDAEVLHLALKRVIEGGSETDYARPSVDILVNNRLVQTLVSQSLMRLLETEETAKQMAVLGTMFHFGMEVGIAYRELTGRDVH